MGDHMSRQSPSPVASWLLAQVLPERNREVVLGDLHEEYVLRARLDRFPTADRWYWGQVCRSIPRLVWNSARQSRWPSTLAVAIGAYILAGIFEFAATWAISKLLAPGTKAFTVVNLVFGLATFVLAGYIAAWIRPAAANFLAGIVLMVVVSLLVTMSESAPLWYGVMFLVGGPLAALAGGTLCRTRNTRSPWDL
jgi:hypothetical protein